MNEPSSGRQGLVAYEDGDAIVLCDPGNPNAWLRSTVVTQGELGERRSIEGREKLSRSTK